jgi:hypothetical protein
MPAVRDRHQGPQQIKVFPTMSLPAEGFVGVNAAAHIAALEALYAVVNPDKLSLVPTMWEKFGAGVWEALLPKYPDVCAGRVRRVGGARGGVALAAWRGRPRDARGYPLTNKFDGCRPSMCAL